MLPHLRRKFFSSISRPGFYTVQAGFVPRFGKDCRGNGRCKNIPRLEAGSRSVGTLSGQPSDPHRTVYTRAFLFFVQEVSPPSLPPSLGREKSKETKSIRRAINRPSQPNPASAPSRSVARLEGKRETSLSLMPAAMLSVSRPISGRGCKATTGE